MTEKETQFYEGKAKKLFTVKGHPDQVIQEFKDDATAFNALKRGSWAHKGEVNCAMSSALFQMLESSGIRTHFIEQLTPVDMLVKRLEIVPLEVIVRNIAAGSFSKRYGVEEGREFKQPTFEFSYKDDPLGDPLINDSHALAMELATEDEIDHIRHTALKINDILKEFFRERGIILVDFKLEFGRALTPTPLPAARGAILLGDEISPDTCRFWDAVTRKKLDKDRFRQDLGGVEEAYAEMLRRVTTSAPTMV